MKILAYIFSFYILSLSMVPCCSIDTCKDEISQVEKTSSSNQKDECTNCLPFFTCGNCSGFVDIAEPIELTVLNIQKPDHQEGIISLIPSLYIALFLQPPRIA